MSLKKQIALYSAGYLSTFSLFSGIDIYHYNNNIKEHPLGKEVYKRSLSDNLQYNMYVSMIWPVSFPVIALFTSLDAFSCIVKKTSDSMASIVDEYSFKKK
jgi:hypothetical protein